jgi:DNA-binding transcriptional regulator YdaS (Cro superfamily)
MAVSANMIRVKGRIASIDGFSAAILARLIGVSPSTMSAALRGVTALPPAKEELCVKLTLRIISLQDALKPCRLPSDVDQLAALLEFVEQNGISDEDVREAISKVFGCTNSSVQL